MLRALLYYYLLASIINFFVNQFLFGFVKNQMYNIDITITNPFMKKTKNQFIGLA